MTARRPGAPRSAGRPVSASRAGSGRRDAETSSPSRRPSSGRGTTGRAGTDRPAAGRTTSGRSSGGRASGSRPATGRGTGRSAAAGSRRQRPAPSARPRSTRARRPGRQDGPAVAITGRALVLITILVVALAALVPTLNTYVAQRQQLTALERTVETKEQQVEDLQRQVQRWEDPAFVQAQARERLLFAMPGETQYRLTDTSGRDVPRTQAEITAEKAAEGPWYSTLWESVEGASRVNPEDLPDPDHTQDTPQDAP